MQEKKKEKKTSNYPRHCQYIASSILVLPHSLPVFLFPGHPFLTQVSFLYEQATAPSHKLRENKPPVHCGSNSAMNSEAVAQFYSCSIVFISLTVTAV